MTGPHITLVASAPRSGGTWAFNAARLVLGAAGRPVHGAWVSDYDPEDPAPFHLVKAHDADQVAFEPDLVITTYRDLAERLASLIRLGWLANTAEAIRASARGQEAIYQYWHAQTDLEIPYADIVGAPDKAIASLAALLGVDLDAAHVKSIADELAALKAPETKPGAYDPVTLLHPRHRNTESATAVDAEEIRRILTALDNA